MTRILAVDPGEVRIGLAISDPTGAIARPLTVIHHVSRQRDAERIVQAAHEQEANMILVGVAYNVEGEVGPQARRALRLVRALQAICELEVSTWDESGSTETALRRGTRDPMLDARSAAVILQEYLDATRP